MVRTHVCPLAIKVTDHCQSYLILYFNALSPWHHKISTKTEPTSNTLLWSLQHLQPSTHGIVGCLIHILPVNLNNLSIRYNTLQISQSVLIIWAVKYTVNRGLMTHQVVAYKRLKTMENKKVGPSVTAACERWLFTRGFNYRDLTGKVLVFLIGDYLWEMIT